MLNLQKEFTGVVAYVSDGAFNNPKGKWCRINLDADVFSDSLMRVYVNGNTPEGEIESFVEKYGLFNKGMRIYGVAEFPKDGLLGMHVPIVQKFDLIKA
jgi:hypothetical protein